jgi:flagellar hook protein FlgE
LQAHQQLLDTVGNNLANTNTTGFKSQRVRFADMLYQTLSQATSATATTGGTNPIQPGLGVRTEAIDTSFAQGGIQTTGGNLDMAIQGQGFFTLSDGAGGNVYTRAGAFAVDQQGFVVDSGSGLRLQRFGTVGEASPTSPAFQTAGVNNISIPLGTGIPGQATQGVVLAGNLSANVSGPQAQVLTSAQPLKSGGAPATAATPLNSLDDNQVKYTAADQLLITGTTQAGVPVSATFNMASFAFPPGPTVGDLTTFVNGLFPGSVASLDASGNLVLKDSTTGPSKSLLGIADGTAATQVGATPWANHALAPTTIGQDGGTINSAIQVFDSQGTGHNLSLVLQKTANDTWSLKATIPGGDGTVIDGTVNGITFNNNGSFQQVTGTGVGDANLILQFNGISTQQPISLNLGAPGGFNGLTQFGGSSSAAATSQDGFAAGSLGTVSVGQDGVISGVFTNGRTLALAQLAMTTFANAGGLNRMGSNLFGLSAQSGNPLTGAAGAGGRGTIQQGALESSNVDVAQEFTQLIVAQRGFSVNARTLTVTDQVMQDLTSIIQ